MNRDKAREMQCEAWTCATRAGARGDVLQAPRIALDPGLTAHHGLVPQGGACSDGSAPRSTPRRAGRRPAADARRTDVQVEPVRTARERDAFIQLQLELYRTIRTTSRPSSPSGGTSSIRDKNPFLVHAELELFLARRGGRSSAASPPSTTRTGTSSTTRTYGFFGMFDCVDDAGVAAALFDAAADWVSSKGFKQMMGPVNLSTNHDCGLLVEGFDHPPAMMMPYNFRVLRARCFEANGFKKAKDLWSLRALHLGGAAGESGPRGGEAARGGRRAGSPAGHEAPPRGDPPDQEHLQRHAGADVGLRAHERTRSSTSSPRGCARWCRSARSCA